MLGSILNWFLFKNPKTEFRNPKKAYEGQSFSDSLRISDFGLRILLLPRQPQMANPKHRSPRLVLQALDLPLVCENDLLNDGKA